MLDVKDLVEGVTKVRILSCPKGVEQDIGDVGTFIFNDNDDELPLKVKFKHDYWYFDPEHLEIVGSEDLIIYKSRWDELVESVNDACNMTQEEEEIVKSVLKNNVPFNVVDLSDPIIEKEEQTHLDATHIGNIGNASLYYKSELLKKWFWWSDEGEWEECDFIWTIDNESRLFPITISK